MPQAYVKKLARKHGISVERAETKWAHAKKSAAKSGHADDYAYITSIFKNMMHESPEVPTLKDITRGMTLKYFLIAEEDEAKPRSPTYQHLQKFPQFNELPFRDRRDIEREVDSEGLLDDYSMLEPEEQESIDDTLQDMIIDRLEKHFGTGVNLANWNEPDQGPSDEELTGEEVPPGPRVRKRKEPSHRAAMRGPHTMELEPEVEPEATPTVGKRKTYYKKWSELSDEQRRGRAALAKKHGKLYRIKNAKWFRLLSPENQEAVIKAVKAGEEIPKF